jgi:error-prone DNA polymerase
MPDIPLTPSRLVLDVDPDTIEKPARAPFVELGLVSCFSFLRGASQPTDLVEAAYSLGYDAIGITDVNSMAGVVRHFTNAKKLKLKPLIGCRIETAEGLAFLAYPKDRAAYGRLCALISAGRMRKLGGEWQDKGACDISLAMLAAHSDRVQLILCPPDDLDADFTIQVDSNVVPLRTSGSSGETRGAQLTATFPQVLPRLAEKLPTLRHLAASYLYRGDDIARIERLDALAKVNGLTLLATNDVHYAIPNKRPLQDVMTAIRHRTTVAKAGYLLHANSERHLKCRSELA